MAETPPAEHHQIESARPERRVGLDFLLHPLGPPRRDSLDRKLVLIPLLFILAMGGILVYTATILRQHEQSQMAIDLAAEVRSLAMRYQSEVLLRCQGLEARPESTLDLQRRLLKTLSEGGPVSGRSSDDPTELEPIHDPETQKELARQATLLKEMEAVARELISTQPEAPQYAPAVAELTRLGAEVQASADRIVKLIGDVSHQTFADMLRWEATLGILTGLLGLLWTMQVKRAGDELQHEVGERHLTQVALQESEERYRDLFENASDLIIIMSPDGRLLYANGAWRDTMGYPESISHLNFGDLIHPDDTRKGLELFQQVVAGGTVQHMEISFRNKSGERIQVEGSMSARFQEGRPTVVRGIFRDLTHRMEAERALRSSETRLRTIVDTAADGILVLDQNGTIELFNPAAERIFGYRQTEVVGENARLLAPTRGPRDAFTANFLTTGQLKAARQALDVVGRRKDGSYFPMELSVSEVYLDKRFTYTAIVRDVSERRAAEEAVERLSRQNALILNAAGEGIVGLDRQGCVTVVNPAACRMLGFERNEIIGRAIHKLTHYERPNGTPYPAEECPVFLAMRDNTVHHVTNELFFRKDESSFPVEYVATPIVEKNEVVGSVVVFRDITERRAIERLKDEFVSVVSHELRTPLTSIRGSLGLLAGGVLGPLPEKGQRMLDIAINNTDRLIRLINDILDIERIESGRVTMQKVPCNAADLMKQAEEAVRGLATKSDVPVLLEPLDIPLMADPDRIIQTLTNLIGNAIKFSPSGAEVSVSVEIKDHEARFAVRDRGRGIPQDKLEEVFERFRQVDASDSREKGGTGLGLTICKSIVQQHHGRIWVESKLGEGSTFFFTLPLLSVPEESGGPLVLLSPWQGAARDQVGRALNDGGYDVLQAHSTDEFIRLARDRQPAAALLDAQSNGLLNRWLSSDATQAIPVIALGTPQESVAEVQEWLPMPPDPQAVLGTLERIVGRHPGVVRVLIVEDDPDLGSVLKASIEKAGYETSIAQDGREGLQMSQKLYPDLLVLDVALPDMDGFGLVERLKRHPRLRSVPVVVYTALDLDDNDRERLRLGPTEFFTKSRVPPAELEPSIRRLLGESTGAERVASHSHSG